MTPRLFVQADLTNGAAVPLCAEQAHYIRNVMRLADGSDVLVFNGREGEWRGTAAHDGKKGVTLTLAAQNRPQVAEPGPWMLFAPIKRTQTDLLVQKATELGAQVLWPVITDRTQAETVRVDRLQSIAIEASEQCERLTVPEVRAPEKLESVMAGWSSDRAVILLAERGDAIPFAQLGEKTAQNSHAFVSGPVGGFSDKELDAYTQLPFVTPVGLGPRTLRAETAVLAALAGWQMLFGDGDERPADL